MFFQIFSVFLDFQYFCCWIFWEFLEIIEFLGFFGIFFPCYYKRNTKSYWGYYWTLKYSKICYFAQWAKKPRPKPSAGARRKPAQRAVSSSWFCIATSADVAASCTGIFRETHKIGTPIRSLILLFNHTFYNILEDTPHCVSQDFIFVFWAHFLPFVGFRSNLTTNYL